MNAFTQVHEIYRPRNMITNLFVSFSVPQPIDIHTPICPRYLRTPADWFHCLATVQSQQQPLNRDRCSVV